MYNSLCEQNVLDIQTCTRSVVLLETFYSDNPRHKIWLYCSICYCNWSNFGNIFEIWVENVCCCIEFHPYEISELKFLDLDYLLIIERQYGIVRVMCCHLILLFIFVQYSEKKVRIDRAGSNVVPNMVNGLLWMNENESCLFTKKREVNWDLEIISIVDRK